VGSKHFSQAHSIIHVKRNWTRLNAIFVRAGLSFLQYPPASSSFSAIRVPTNVSTGAQALGVSVLSRVMPNWGDRRAERWDRWRRENGKKTRNPGRMRGVKKSVRCLGEDVGYYDI
jgi:hypothetical protein